MREHEKTRRINSEFEGAIVERILRGPKEKEAEFIKIALILGFREVSEPIPWREAFPECTDEQLPCVSLIGARHKEGLTQKQLADKLGIKQGYVSDIEAGKRSIGKTMAKRLGTVLNISYKVFL